MHAVSFQSLKGGAAFIRPWLQVLERQRAFRLGFANGGTWTPIAQFKSSTRQDRKEKAPADLSVLDQLRMIANRKNDAA